MTDGGAGAVEREARTGGVVTVVGSARLTRLMGGSAGGVGCERDFNSIGGKSSDAGCERDFSLIGGKVGGGDVDCRRGSTRATALAGAALTV